MNKRLLELQLKRGRLLERVAHQRLELALQLTPVKTAMGTASRLVTMGQSGIDFIRKNPLLILAALTTVLILRPKGAWWLVRTSLLVWRGWRMLRALIPESVLSPLYQHVWQSLWQHFARRTPS